MSQQSATLAPAEDQPDDLVEFGQEFKSAVDSILEAYPNFRILILGRSGVGKSNLITAIFGTGFVTVEHGRKAGVSDIEREITSPQNPRLILHDSQGFSHGSGDNFSTVKNFIQTRSQTENLKDRLHAIWLCSAVPTYGGSLLEIGEEEILHMVKDCNVPIVAVFTKYDVLVESLKPPDEDDFYGDIEKEIENLDTGVDPTMGLNIGTSAHQIDPDVLSLAEAELDNMIEPFGEMLRGIRWVKVSAKPEFSDTLDELVDVTKDRINKSLQLLWAATQQQSVLPKINASIDIGKKKYWRGLSTSLTLAGKSLDKWFKVIHEDIVTIWGIHDPTNILTTLAARVMSELQQDLIEGGGGIGSRNIRARPTHTVAAGPAVVAPHVSSFTDSIATGFVFATWVYRIAFVTPNVLRGMMGYIVDLTIVMQSLFILMQARTEASGSRIPVSERLFNIALDAYKQDIEHSLENVHDDIRSFVTIKKAIFKSEAVIKKVERLIHDHRFKPSEQFLELARMETKSDNLKSL